MWNSGLSLTAYAKNSAAADAPRSTAPTTCTVESRAKIKSAQTIAKKCSRAHNVPWRTTCEIQHPNTPLRTFSFPWLLSRVSFHGRWLHEFKLATVRYITRPKMATELERQVAGHSWLGMGCKEPSWKQALETALAMFRWHELKQGPLVRLVTWVWLLLLFPKMTEINRWMNQLPGLMYST